MLTTLAVHGFRSLRDLVMPLAPVTVVTGPNGAGKSSLYRALRLLSETVSGSLVGSLARDGGLSRVLWAGPETISGAMRRDEVPVQGTSSRRKPVSLQLGFASQDLGYVIDIGLPLPRRTVFLRDPVIKREAIFNGPVMRPASTLMDRAGSQVRVRSDRGWRSVGSDLPDQVSFLSEMADPAAFPEALATRRTVSGWRFYDAFRTDPLAPARQPQVGTWTPVLANDGSDLASAIQTILESAWEVPLRQALEEAFPGGEVGVVDLEGRFEVQFNQRGLLRPLNAAELSDGTLRFLLLATALLSPQPPGLLVLNEPETSLHPDVIPVLARLVVAAAERTQVLVVSHSDRILDTLRRAHSASVVHHELVKDLGETVIADQGLLSRPTWNWGSR